MASKSTYICYKMYLKRFISKLIIGCIGIRFIAIYCISYYVPDMAFRMDWLIIKWIGENW